MARNDGQLISCLSELLALDCAAHADPIAGPGLCREVGVHPHGSDCRINVIVPSSREWGRKLIQKQPAHAPFHKGTFLGASLNGNICHGSLLLTYTGIHANCSEGKVVRQLAVQGVPGIIVLLQTQRANHSTAPSGGMAQPQVLAPGHSRLYPAIPLLLFLCFLFLMFKFKAETCLEAASSGGIQTQESQAGDGSYAPGWLPHPQIGVQSLLRAAEKPAGSTSEPAEARVGSVPPGQWRFVLELLGAGSAPADSGSGPWDFTAPKNGWSKKGIWPHPLDALLPALWHHIIPLMLGVSPASFQPLYTSGTH